VPESERDVVGAHRDWIARDVLATDLQVGSALAIRKS
jgi:hypothetical protein